MARIRSIKPEFFTSLTIASLSLPTRLTFIGLWTHVDDEGRCVDDARLIRAAVWPLDDRLAGDVEGDLKALTESSLILRYKVGGRRYIAVRGWSEHQRINRPTESRWPPPSEASKPPPTSGNEDSPPTHAQLSEDSLPERNREQGTGKGTGKNTRPPPLRDVGPAFDRFWSAYPRKVRKDSARRAWQGAVQRAAPGDIAAGAERMAQDPNLPEAQFVPHPATWLNGGGWDDEPYPDRRRKPEPRTSTTDDRVSAAADLVAKYRNLEESRPDLIALEGGAQ